MAVTFDEALSRSRLHPFQWATFAVCMLVLVGDGIDLQLLGLVAPVIIEDWGVDRGNFGWAMSAALVGMGIGAWIGGSAGDRIGRRNALAVSSASPLSPRARLTRSPVWPAFAWLAVWASARLFPTR